MAIIFHPQNSFATIQLENCVKNLLVEGGKKNFRVLLILVFMKDIRNETRLIKPLLKMFTYYYSPKKACRVTRYLVDIVQKLQIMI